MGNYREHLQKIHTKIHRLSKVTGCGLDDRGSAPVNVTFIFIYMSTSSLEPLGFPYSR